MMDPMTTDGFLRIIDDAARRQIAEIARDLDEEFLTSSPA